jgi:RND family efflux transporter MFP subunit
MKKAFIITILTLFLTFAAGCETQEKPNPALHDAPRLPFTYTLESEPYSAKVSLTGTLEAKKKTYVSTKASGRIANLYYDVGDSVKKGDLLGALSGEETLINLGTAHLDEQNAQIVYSSQKKLLDEQIESVKNMLEKAETAVELAKTSSTDIKETTGEQTNLAEQSVEQAQTALEIAESVAEQRISSLNDGAVSTIRNCVLAASAAHTYAENLLEVNENRSNSYHDKYYKFFGVLDSNTRRAAEKSLKESYELYKNIEGSLDELEALEPNTETYMVYMKDTLEMLEATQDMLTDVYLMLNKSISMPLFPESALNALREEALTRSKTIEDAILSISPAGTKRGAKGWMVMYDELTTQNNAEINAAQSQLLTAQQKVNEVEAGASQYVSSAENQISILEKDVEQAKLAVISAETQKQNVLRQLERELNVVRGTADLSEAALANTQVIAPFDGIITAKFAEEGVVMPAGQPVFELSNTDEFKIVTDLPDTYISKLEIDLKAEISINGSPGKYSGTLSQINPNVNPINHKLKIEFELDEIPKNVKIGQFARISLKCPEEDAYFVPHNFVYQDFEGPYVVLDSGERQAVSTSIEKDGFVRIWWADIKENMVITR